MVFRDFVETSPEKLGNFCFSLKIWPFSETTGLDISLSSKMGVTQLSSCMTVCASDVPVCACTKRMWRLNSFETAFEEPDYAQERVSTL